MQTLTIISLVLLSLIIVFTLFQQVRRDEWWIRLADFPHMQITILTVITWVVLFIAADLHKPLNIALLVLGFATIVYQLIIIYPYTQFAKTQVAQAPDTGNHVNISLLESNVYMYNREYHKLHECIRKHDPDIFIGLETDGEWIRQLKMQHPDYTHVLDVPLNNTYGMILMSRIPFKNQKVRFLVEDDIPSFKVELALDNDQSALLYVIHPTPPSPTENPTSTERDVELIKIGREIKSIDRPILVAGDLNDVAWSHTTRLFQRISGLLDPRKGRGLFNTFHANYSLLRWPLDHIFHSEHFTLVDMQRCEKVGSDHFPMFVTVALTENYGKHTNGDVPEPDEEDMEESEEKIEKLEEKEA